jgi:hypothetical protein
VEPSAALVVEAAVGRVAQLGRAERETRRPAAPPHALDDEGVRGLRRRVRLDRQQSPQGGSLEGQGHDGRRFRAQPLRRREARETVGAGVEVAAARADDAPRRRPFGQPRLQGRGQLARRRAEQHRVTPGVVAEELEEFDCLLVGRVRAPEAEHRRSAGVLR